MTNSLCCRALTNAPLSRRRVLLASAAVLALMSGMIAPPLARAQQTPRTATAAITTTDGSLVAPPLSLLWRFTGAPQSNNSNSPLIAGNLVYFTARLEASGPGTLFALDANTGERVWVYQLNGNNLFRTAPTIDNGNIYIGASDGSVCVVNAQTGSEVLRFRTARPIESRPTVSEGTLYFGSNDGTFYALDPQTGAQAWRNPYKTGSDAINSAPVIADSFVFFTTNGGIVHAVKQATGLGRWSFRLSNRVLANSLIYIDNGVFVPSGQRVYSFQPASGVTRWQRDMPGDVIAPLVAVSGTIYTITKDVRGTGAFLSAIRTNNGKDAWAKPAEIPAPPAAAPTISGDVIYVPTTRGIVYAVSREDGHILWEYHVSPSTNGAGQPAANVSLTAPVTVAGGAVYVMGDDGSLSAFRPDAPDTTGPVLSSLYPAAAQRVNGNPPLTIAATAVDTGSGINPESVKLRIDDKEVAADYDTARNLVFYQTHSTGKLIDPPLPQGRHKATLSVADWRGNVTEQSWSFIVDNSVPPATTREAPTRGLSRPSGRPGVTGPGAGGNTGRRGGRGGRGGGNGGGNL